MEEVSTYAEIYPWTAIERLTILLKSNLSN